jgi:hypothetical protein
MSPLTKVTAAFTILCVATEIRDMRMVRRAAGPTIFDLRPGDGAGPLHFDMGRTDVEAAMGMPGLSRSARQGGGARIEGKPAQGVADRFAAGEPGPVGFDPG